MHRQIIYRRGKLIRPNKYCMITIYQGDLNHHEEEENETRPSFLLQAYDAPESVTYQLQIEYAQYVILRAQYQNSMRPLASMTATSDDRFWSYVLNHVQLGSIDRHDHDDVSAVNPAQLILYRTIGGQPFVCP